MARYAISDIHGCLRTFKKVLRSVDFNKSDTLILLGDYIDRGLDSKGVIQYIIDLIAEGYDVIPLCGNHEQFLIESIGNNAVQTMWERNGGDKCLRSYGVNHPSLMPHEHISFIRSLPLMHVERDYVFVHAGLDFCKEDPIEESSDETILWSRMHRLAGDSRRKKLGGRVLVTGHTPTDKKTMITMAMGEDMITIDRGCVFEGSNYNHMAIFNLDTKQFNFIKNIDTLENDWVSRHGYAGR
jgi:serine/threonine protein phosphatase 1